VTAEHDDHFRVSAEVLTRLGEELITDSTQALLELVKNAYDADAQTVRVEIETSAMTDLGGNGVPGSGSERDATLRDAVADTPSAKEEDSRLVGYVRVSDTGHGMDEDAVRNGWLTLSASPKRAMKDAGRKTARGRTPLGDKGLGRLGAQRLGDLVSVRTRPTVPPEHVPDPKAEDPPTPVEEHRVAFRFSDFMPSIMLDAVDVSWTTRTINEANEEPWPLRTPWGTILEIKGLREPDEWLTTGRLSNELSKVVNPFRGVERFKINVRVNGQPLDLHGIGRNVRRAALTAWKARFDGRRITVEGRMRPQHFRPRDADARELLEQRLLKDGGKGLAAAITRAESLKPFKPKPAKDPHLVTLRRRIDLDDFGTPDGFDAEWWERHPCGPFTMEIDTLSLDFGVMRSADLSVFDTQKLYREWMKERAGVAIYRDGFRVAAGEDMLELGKGFTSGGSFYSLRPGNVLGYIAITARENEALEETTDREGLRDTPASRTFFQVLRIIRDEINKAMDESGRAATEYIKRVNREDRETDASLEELSEETQRALTRAKHVSQAVATARESVESAARQEGMAAEHPEAASQLEQAASTLKETEASLAQIERLSPLVDALRQDARDMRDQLDETYQLIGLGLVAEALAHELTQSVRRLTERSAAIRDLLAAMPERDPEIDLFIEEVESVARSLRTQVRHLDPQLRYARERRKRVDLAELVRDTFEYHRDRLRGEPIKLVVQAHHPAFVHVVPGRVMQVLDNLVINAEYWIRQDMAKGRLSEGQIKASISGARCTITDNGPGVSPDLADSIFEAFVSGKANGRGLGLFISRQLLDAENGTLTLKAHRDERPRAFEIDLSEQIAES
jgi:signal transduction histidine kinase